MSNHDEAHESLNYFNQAVNDKKFKMEVNINDFVVKKGDNSVFITLDGSGIGVCGMDQHGNVLDEIATKKGIELEGEDRPAFAMEQGLIYKSSFADEIYYIADKRIGTRAQVITAIKKNIENTGFKGKAILEYNEKQEEITA